LNPNPFIDGGLKADPVLPLLLALLLAPLLP
jgi:hypothetical protein